MFRWLIALTLIFAACSKEEPTYQHHDDPPEPHAYLVGHVSHWHQDVYNGQYWGLTVTIHLENIGERTASYYEAYYYVALSNGDTLSDWANGLNLPPGRSVDVQSYTPILNHARVEAVWLYDIDWNE